MKVGVIGTGQMGKNHIRIYNELKSVNDIYIFDVDKKSMEDVEKKYSNVYCCNNIKSMIDVVDCVSVVVPTQYHKSTVNEILSYSDDVNILIEKPICSTINDGIEIVKKIPETIISGVGHIERFNPIVPELKKIVKNPLYVEFKRHNPSSSRIIGSDVVEDLMIHDIDIMRELFCKAPTSIYGSGNNDIHTATIMNHGVPIYLSASRKSSKKIRSIYIEMEEFTIEADYMSQEIIIYSKPGRFKVENEKYTQENVVEKVIVNKTEPLKEELRTFINCCTHKTPFPVSTNDAINNMMICEAIKHNYRPYIISKNA